MRTTIKKNFFLLLLVTALRFDVSSQTNISDSNMIKDRLFPVSNYTPYGYLDNPSHSFVFNRSGIIRSVPPLGFGFWCRSLPWPYANNASRDVNYLSFIHLSINQDGTVFDSTENFKENNVQLQSSYHTKNIMSYNWNYKNLDYDVKYLYPSEDVILCIFSVKNSNATGSKLTIHATNIYGYPEKRWWGSDGSTSHFNNEASAAISKIWAYGDVFVLGADKKSVSYKATASETDWKNWIFNTDLSSNNGAVTTYPNPVFAVQSYQLDVAANATTSIILSLTRGKNEMDAIHRYKESLANAIPLLNEKEKEDDLFYKNSPLLTGDWPKEWKHGWIYDIETLRMTVRPPLGIFKHHWDGMQVFSPRSVLGETALDAMCLSYTDVNLAKEILLGIFADAVYPNLPCTREDASMNMIGADGRECGTAPIWGMPFYVISSIYNRDKDNQWLADLYPYLKNYIEWWLKNRTDSAGWFHAANSWESGQDGSRRFLMAEHNEGAAADFVRTVDIEAAMAHAMEVMQDFAQVTNHQADISYWKELADERLKRTRAMFVNGWFRDVDARTSQPIILKDYYDVMMFLPVSLKIATDEQMKELVPMYPKFANNPVHFLEWPSFLLPFTEAAWNNGLRLLAAEEVAKVGNRIYQRMDERKLHPVLIKEYENMLPAKYSYRIPGISNEFWPISDTNPGGAENYGWGATLPTLVIRNIIGFREFDNNEGNGFFLSPSLPENLVKPGQSIGIDNLMYNESRLAIHYSLNEKNKISCKFSLETKKETIIKILNAKNEVVFNSQKQIKNTVSFMAKNGEVYRVFLNQ